MRGFLLQVVCTSQKNEDILCPGNVVGYSVVKAQSQLDLSVEWHFDWLTRHHAMLHAVYVKTVFCFIRAQAVCSVYGECKGASVLFNLLSQVNVQSK